MPRYLSPEWLEAAQRAIDARASRPGAAAGVDIVVQHVVGGGVDGDVTYHVRLADDGVSIREGEAPDPTVVFSEDYATAAAISRGELSAQSAFITGRIKVHGDLPRLVEQSRAFGEIEDALAGLRSETSY
jgi:hypothetical protein